MKGAGMGLTFCKFLVEQFMGKIEVDSEIGKGSKFTFSILVKDMTHKMKTSAFKE